MLAQWDLQILLVPGILLVLLFSYVPMYGVVMGFQDFQLGDFPGFSQWVGFKHFQTMFADKYFGLAMRNTLVISALKMFIGFPLPIFFAVLLNEMNFQPLKKTVQTVSYLPHFISWVVCATLMFDLMSTDGGAINEFLMWIGVIKEPIGFFTEGKYFWGITLCTDIWRSLAGTRSSSSPLSRASARICMKRLISTAQRAHRRCGISQLSPSNRPSS